MNIIRSFLVGFVLAFLPPDSTHAAAVGCRLEGFAHE